jgi:hypothetical protein
MRKTGRRLVGWAACLLGAASYALVVYFILTNSQNSAAPVTASLLGAGIALVTGLIALVREPILAWVRQPRLFIDIQTQDRRDCHTTQFKDQNNTFLANAHYLRLRIENRGSRSAEKVEATIEAVRRFSGGKYEIDQAFMPLRLMWSHWPDPRYELAVPPDSFRHCDLGFIIEPRPNLPSSLPAPMESGKLLIQLSTLIRPNAGRTSLLPGDYEVVISASGHDVAKTIQTLKIHWDGTWYSSLDETLKGALRLAK